MRVRLGAIATTLALCALLLPSLARAGASTIFVDQNASGANNGTSWTNAYNTIGQGIAAAGGGYAIFVADGTYEEAVTTQSNFVSIYGGFEGAGGAEETISTQANPVANPTIIDGSTANAGGPTTHVLTVNHGSLYIDGFTITGGAAVPGGSSTALGGGIHVGSGGNNLTAVSCTITSNTSVGAGAAVYIDASNASFVNCVIANNAADTAGGGIYTYDATGIKIINCTFSNNSTGTTGVRRGGALQDGAALLVEQADAIVVNSIFEGHAGTAVAEGSSSFDIATTNCIFFNNPDGHFVDGVSGTLSDVASINALSDCSGNISGDPLFVNSAAGDYHISSGSAADGAGLDVTSLGAPYSHAAEDYENENRSAATEIDIGADEYDGASVHDWQQLHH